MKRSSVTVQADLFNNVPALPAIPNSHPNRDELVELLAKLLREVILMSTEQIEAERTNHDQN